MAVKEKEVKEKGITDPAANQPAKPVKKDVPEKFFIVSEGALNALVAAVTKLPWMDANPIISLVQQNFKEVKNDV